MSKPVITVEKLCKAYRIGAKEEVPDTLFGAAKGILLSPLKNIKNLRGLDTSSLSSQSGKRSAASDETLWAVKDVSFEVNQGDVVGVIGRNGAGKSTLLKILSRITEPTSGRVSIRGRVSSLLEVGTGFHPDLTGRENVYMNGTILGMTKREIDRKFDEIVEFSGVSKFLDTPTKRYSSGMQVRLAFAVAAHLEPEILIIDEVLAVGDAEFQNKCLGKMKDVSKAGRTVLFVSHNMIAVRELCTRGIVMVDGGVGVDTDAETAIEEYLHASANCKPSNLSNIDSEVDEPIKINSFSVALEGSQPNHRLKVVVELFSRRPHQNAFVAIDIHDHMGTWVMQAIPQMEGFLAYDSEPKVMEIEVDLPPLIPNTYGVGLWVGDSLKNTLTELRDAIAFTVDRSPTPNRTAPHSVARGYIVPVSRIRQLSKKL